MYEGLIPSDLQLQPIAEPFNVTLGTYSNNALFLLCSGQYSFLLRPLLALLIRFSALSHCTIFDSPQWPCTQYVY